MTQSDSRCRQRNGGVEAYWGALGRTARCCGVGGGLEKLGIRFGQVLEVREGLRARLRFDRNYVALGLQIMGQDGRAVYCSFDLRC